MMQLHRPWRLLYVFLLGSGIIAHGGCTTTTIRTVDMRPPAELLHTVAEDQLLDIGILLFDPNIAEKFEDRDRQAVVPAVRQAEAAFMPWTMKHILESTGNWGAVRVMPRGSTAVDLTVTARILHSTGERLTLQVTVVDSAGVTWIDKPYTEQATRYAYETADPSAPDAFHPLYRQIANDMLAFYSALSPTERRRIRHTSELRFAAEFSPDAFGEHVVAADDGWKIRRLPAENDPMLARIRQIREREYLFIDTLNGHYDIFHQQMNGPYQNWRMAGYEDAILRERRAQQARNRGVAGAVLIAGGIAGAVGAPGPYSRAASHLGIIAGAGLFVDSIAKRAEAQLHREALIELGESLNAEITPHLIQLDNEELRLTGTIDEQYDRWRNILGELYTSDLGLQMAPTIVTAETPAAAPAGTAPPAADSNAAADTGN